MHAVVAGLCATLVGIGLARFAYTPLIPALIAEGWFSPSRAVYLGAANLAGYLAGALLGGPMASRVSATFVLRGMMAMATAAFFACAWPLSFTWFLAWRFAAGVAGGALMVLAAPSVLPHVPPERRGVTGGIILTGVGLGIAASGTLVPVLMRGGLRETWIGLGVLSLVLTGIAWAGWPAAARQRGAAPAAGDASRPAWSPALKALFVEYAFNALGLVVHMVFLVDFVARGLGQGLAAGAGYWVLFGLGALVGPMLAGALADRIGFGAAVRLSLLVQALAVALPVVPIGSIRLIVSSIVIGALVPGFTTLVLGRVHELAPAAARTRAWGVATIAFAVGQAVGAYALSALFARTGSHALLFELAAAAMVVALAIDLAASRARG